MIPRFERVILAVVGFVILAACSPGSPGGAAGGRDALPDATLAILGTEQVQDVQKLLGDKPLVVNFWASWCPFCIDEMPDFERVNQALADRVTFVGVNREDALDEALRLEVETGVTYPSLVDADGSFFAAAGGRGMPTTLLVAPDGEIRERVSGPLSEDRLRDLIDQTFPLAREN